MVKFMSNWAGQVIIVVIISTIIEMILPKGKIKKYVKVVLSIYVLFGIISPIVKNKNTDIKEEINLNTYKNNITTGKINQNSMDGRIEELYIKELENNISSVVESQGYKVNKCKVTAILNTSNKNSGIKKIELIVANNKNTDKVQKVKISIAGKEIVGTKNSTELKKFLSEYYEIEQDKISIKTSDE